MNNNNIDFEYAFYQYVKMFKVFMSQLSEIFKLEEHPYNLSGNRFPKIGVVIINNDEVKYRFHGNGCTIWWKNVEIFFNIILKREIDTLMVTPHGWSSFLNSYIENYDKEKDNYGELLKLEVMGVLTRDGNTSISYFFVKESWYNKYQMNEQT